MQLSSFIRTILGSIKSAGRSHDAQWTTLTGGSVEEVNERNLLLANREWVYIAADKNARSVSGVRFKVMRYSGQSDDQEVFKGPLVDFLERPAPGLTGKDFLYLNTVYKELTGNAFWEKEGKPLALAAHIPSSVAPVIQGGKLVGYKVPAANGGQRTIMVEDMLHDRYIDPARPYWGVGRLLKIARWVDTSFFTGEFLRLFFINGSIFGGFIETEEENSDRIKIIRAGLANDHSGVRNAHKIGVLPKGNKYAASSVDLQKLQFGESDDRYRDKILAAFGVPKNLLGITSGENRATVEGTEYAYMKHTIKPIVDDLIEFLNVRVAPLLDPSGKAYFAYDDFIPRNQELDIKRRESALAKHAYMTINEVRAEAGLPPVTDGDEVPQPLPPPGNDNKSDAKGRYMRLEQGVVRTIRPAPRHVRTTLAYEHGVKDIASGIADAVEETLDPDTIAHRDFVSRVDAYEKLLAGKVRDFNGKQRNDVLQRLNQITKAVAKTDLFDMDIEVGAMVDFVTPLLKGLMIEQAIEEYLAQEFDGEFDQTQANINTIIEHAAKRLARSYNNTTADLLKKALSEGISNNDDITQLAARVNEVYDYSDLVRAEAVARTETFYIANEGSREAYRQSGVVKSVRWYTSEDERVCEFCGPEHGRTVGVTETFYPKGHELTGKDGGTLKLDYRTIDVPPIHTNCRCFIRPAEIDIA